MPDSHHTRALRLSKTRYRGLQSGTGLDSIPNYWA